MSAVTRICRDEDCPTCAWPETYTEVDFDTLPLTVLSVGCTKCGWTVALTSAAKS